MSLPEFSIGRPVTVFMGTLILVLLGGIAFVNLPVDLMPDAVYPTISVRAEYPGVAPEEMENLVARPMEEAFASAPGVTEISSRSSEGTTFVRVSFDYGMNLDEAANELRIRLDRRRGSLPEDMEPPVMYKFDVSQFPIMFLTVATQDMDPKALRHFVEKQLQYRLERVPGVAQFTVRGGLRREIHVALNLSKLRALNLSMREIATILRQENLNRPVGPVKEGRFEVLLRTQGEFQTLEDIRNLVVATRNAVPVHLREIADVEDSHEEVRQIVRVNGSPAVRLFVYKQSGANTVDVANAVWKEIGQIHKDHPNIRISATGDTSEFIKAAIGNVKDSAIQGAGLAVLILLLFLRSFSSVLIIGIAIPISVISTFALMYFAGFTLNTVSFGGLALGVGMLVDNAIVVLENVYRLREKGRGAREAAVMGSKQVSTAIAASTLTTLAVFVPVVFTKGVSAVTFQQLAYVVSFSLACSLLVALTIVPVLCARYLQRDPSRDRKGVLGAAYRAAGNAQQLLADEYGKVLEWALRHRRIVVAGAAMATLGAVLMVPLVGVELTPQADEGEIRADVELEPGTRVEITDGLLQRLARIAMDNVPEIQNIMTESGGGGFSSGSAQHIGELRIRLVPRDQRTRNASAIANDIRPKLMVAAGVVIRTRISSGSFMRGSRSAEGDRLSVEIRGHDLAVLDRLSLEVRDAMATIPGVPEVQVSRKPGMPEMLLRVDRLKASTMGMNVSDIAEAMETAIGGRRTSMFRQQGDEFNILLRLREPDRLDLRQVAQIPLTTPVGQTIPAGTVVEMRRQEGPVSIERLDQERITIVSGTLGDRDLGSVVKELDEKLKKIKRPPNYEFRFGGEYLEQQETFRQLTFAAILALLLVYMIMASQFESLRDPFIILFSIPVAGVGVMLMLVITNTTFNMQGFLGVIILVGIVVNNAIVLVDYTNQLRRDSDYGIRDAVITAGTRRLRPILMTTTTTVLGLIPMAMGIGEGSELQVPLARVVIGGLTASTLITLVLVPVVYSILEEWGERKKDPSQPEAASERMELAEAKGD